MLLFDVRGDWSFSNFTAGLLVIFVLCMSFDFIKEWIKKRKKGPPGPTGLPFVGYLPFLGSKPHETLWKMKEKYGNIISLYMGNKYTVILNDFEIAKEVLSHPAALNRAPDLFKSLPFRGFHEENGEKWIEQRRFSMSAMRDLGLGKGSWENNLIEDARNFTEELQKKGGKPTDFSKPLTLSLNSGILRLLIGRNLDKMKESDEVELAVHFSEVALSFLGPSEPANLVPGLRRILEFTRMFGYDKAAKIIRNFSSFIKHEVARHKTSNFHNAQDFINKYLNELEKSSNSKNTKHYFSEDRLLGNLAVLFLGGSDTVVSSTTWLLRIMADHQDVQARVHFELMRVLGKDGIARYSERDKFPYTFAVLMESQRFSSIVPLSTTRWLSQDIAIKEFILPKGAEVSVNVWGLHFDPKYWIEPEKFEPERFLTDNGTKLIKNPRSYAPFSVGKRNCPGEHIAWKEILGYFTEIIKKFEIKNPPGVKPKYDVIDGLVVNLKPVPLCFIERK